jgi:hypothetical protein
MVLSIKKYFKEKIINMHYCNICGVKYFDIIKAIECELKHNELKNMNTDKYKTNVKKSNIIKNIYRVVIYHSFNNKISEFYIRAKNIKQASKIVKEKNSSCFNFYIEKTYNIK